MQTSSLSRSTLVVEIDGLSLRCEVVWRVDVGADVGTDVRPRPAVLVLHAFGGLSDFERGRALELAELGVVGVAVDLYGDGALAQDAVQARSWMNALVGDRSVVRRRLAAVLAAVRGHEAVDPGQIAAIGFCMGGLCALELARSGAEVEGVVSFHGLLGRSELQTVAPMRAKVLVLHGWSDPMAPPEAVLGLSQELDGAGADWQLIAYGGQVHAFTNPAAAGPADQLRYDAATDRRSAAAMRSFLRELWPA